MSSTQPIQLPLGIALRDDARFENYLEAENSLACAMLKQAAAGVGEQFLFIWGIEGVGSTHLLQSVCHAVEPYHRTAVYLPLDELIELGPGILEGMEHLDLVCIDNLQVIVGNRQWEEAIFHFFNRIRDLKHNLIVAADLPPRQLGVELPDLASRLTWGMVFQIHGLDDDSKLKVLRMRAASRGLELADDVAKYLFHHGSRSMADLFKVLDRLDQASLQAKRKITIPFIKEVLGW